MLEQEKELSNIENIYLKIRLRSKKNLRFRYCQCIMINAKMYYRLPI